MREKAALIIVDVQNDFCPGGALGVQSGDEIVPILNRYIDKFRAAGLRVIATRDWHPERTSHFKRYGGVWPDHCVQGSPGAAFHANLRLASDSSGMSQGKGEDDERHPACHSQDRRGTPRVCSR